MSVPAHFRDELVRLVAKFEDELAGHRSSAYDEAALRNDFLNPFWRALGWDLENRAGLPQSLREVELETRVDVAGRKKRADYIFRTEGVERFICEAKKPKEELIARYAYQVQRYAFNLKLYVSVLTNFEQFQIFVVGGKPDPHAPFVPVENLHFHEFHSQASRFWELFDRQNVASGSLDQYVRSLPKRPIRGRPRQGWLIKPERTRTVDAEFLAYIEQQRVELAHNLVRENSTFHWDQSNLNEAVQRILDRILFIRICEDRDIDTGATLERMVEDWRRVSYGQSPLYPQLVGHFQSLDESFNGALFGKHFSEHLVVSDGFLCNLIGELSSEDSPYLFSTLPVEILGSVYERFIGQVVPISKSGRVKPVEPKPEVRKAGGVYYTPRYIVAYIVENTVGKLLQNKNPKEIAKIKILDPACGSGSFLIRAFERVCQHYLIWFHEHPRQQNEQDCYHDRQGNLRLTPHLKRQILLNNIFGVDVDQRAVEVTLLSLYLKILEGETRTSLAYQQRLFPRESFLPDLSRNIRLGNSLVESDFFDLFSDGEERKRIKPFDWRAGFAEIMRAGGFDAVIGNPPYVTGELIPDNQVDYLKSKYEAAFGKFDLYMVFLEKAVKLTTDHGFVGFIIPNKFMVTNAGKGLREFLQDKPLKEIVDFSDSGVFEGVTNYPCIVTIGPNSHVNLLYRLCQRKPEAEIRRVEIRRDSLTNRPWNFLEPEEAAILAKIENSSTERLGNLVERFLSGVQTGADKILLFTDHAVRSCKFERAYLRKFLRGRNVRRYVIEWDGRFIFWPYDSKSDEILTEPTLRRRARRLYKMLLTNKPILARRVWFGKTAQELSGAWFGLMYREPDINFRKLHIVTPCLSSHVNFALNEDGFRFATGTAGVMGILPKDGTRENYLYLLGLLNSKIVEFFVKRRSPRFAGGFFKFTAPYLKGLPLPRLDLAQQDHKQKHQRMIRLVKHMLELARETQKATSDAHRQTLENSLRATDKSIDELVYELYGLSKAETLLIEESISGKVR